MLLSEFKIKLLFKVYFFSIVKILKTQESGKFITNNRF